MDTRAVGRGTRARLIREATGLQQAPFAQLLSTAAARIGVVERYIASKVSKIETESRTMTLDDVTVLASVDPERRGKLWLGWDECEDSTMYAPPKPAKVVYTSGHTIASKRPKAG